MPIPIDFQLLTILPLIQNYFVDLMVATGNQTLATIDFKVDPRFATTVVMVSGGYPGNYEKGYEVKGLDKATESIVFHSGTSLTNGQVVTNGGRVLAVTSLDDTLQGALDKSYQTAHQINFDYAYYRKDIGKDLM
jgi:phosphoribosylamine--glycine ligase